MWRIRSQLLPHQGSYRITSTCVENTRLKILEVYQFEDHLHMCGEYYTSKYLVLAGLGSPPHVWRILSELQAYARLHGDHLHMCGEYSKQIPL